MSKAELRKAAVLLMTLPAEQADRLLARLTPAEVEAVTAEMARVESLTAAEQEAVVLAFAAVEPVDNATDRPSELVRADAAHDRPQRPFSFARNFDSHTVADALADERPQTIALVASHVPSALGAELVASLEPRSQLAVIRAVAAMEPTDPHVVAEVSEALSQRLDALAH
jgi:flagellar motor switch protein FliG